MPESCFVLLDDSRATPEDPRSRLYTRHVRTLYAEGGNVEALPRLFRELEQALCEGLHAVALLSYEDGALAQGIPALQHARDMASHILLFEDVAHLSAEAADTWLSQAEQHAAAPGEENVSGIAGPSPDISEERFIADVERIRRYIEAGDTYQVNYTYRLRFNAYGSAPALYRRLRARQPVPYGALMQLPDGRAVLSLSPELFVRHRSGTLTAQPMKGTAASSAIDAQTQAKALQLAADPKNRAENLMIVDLLRNDLGRIAVPGSVRVPALFEVARYGTVLQMTSTIDASLRPDAALADVIEALYPCGSITGAPKRRTMQIIRELEKSPRGWYTGGIGWFDPPREGRQIGDFCLSVPIRTLVLDAPENGAAAGTRAGEMGVGAGIVHDSRAEDELAECRLKTRFLTGLPPQFSLFETIRVTRDSGCCFLDRHLERLRASACALGFPWSSEAARHALEQVLDVLPESESGIWRVKLQLDPCGAFQVQSASLAPLPTPVRVRLAPHRMAAGDFLLRHKTTRRAQYDAAWHEAEAHGAFDMLFRNEYGNITEGGRSNVFIKRRGQWVTPPVDAGVLPGIMRGVLLEDPQWNAVEAPLSLQDLLEAEAIVVCNALRGVLPAVLDMG